MRTFALILLLLWPTCLWAEYTSSEILVIPWGEEAEQLKFRPEETTYYNPGGVAPGYEVDPGAGPTGVFVDQDENFIFYSSEFGQLKAFNNLGQLVFDFSYGEPGYNQEIHTGGVAGVYVNPRLEMYVVDAYDRNYVPIVDYNGDLVDRIYPFESDSSVPILSIYPKFNGDICFYGLDQGFVTYSDDHFSPGGTPGFMATNRHFYTVWSYSTHSIEFNDYQNPDTSGKAEMRELKMIEYPDETILSAGVLQGGNGDRLYLAVVPDTLGEGQIWELDLNYNILDRLIYEVSPEGTVWGLDTFIHPNSNIYRFPCLEDGVHVIRWSKE